MGMLDLLFGGQQQPQQPAAPIDPQMAAILAQVQQMSQPTPDDRRAAQAAQFQAMMGSLVGARKGFEGDALGRGGLLSMQAYQQQLHDALARRSQAMAQASAAMNLQNQMQTYHDTQQERNILMGSRPQAIAGASGAPPVAPGGAMDMSGDAGTGLPGTPPMPQQPQVAQQAPQQAPQPGLTPGQNVTGPLALKRQQQAYLLQIADAARTAGRGDLYLKYQAEAAKLEPELKETKTLTVPDGSPQGKRITVNLYKDGSQEVLPFGPDAEKAHFGTDGKFGNIAFDAFNGQRLSAGTPMQVTPGEQLSADMQGRGQDITIRGQNLTNARAADANALRRVEIDPMGILGLNKGGIASGGGAQQGTPGAAIASGLHGDEFLKTLEPSVAAQVKALADGNMSFPTGYALRSPMIQGLIQLVAQYDPNFDAVNYQSRAATRKAFTSGTPAASIAAMNTALGHFDNLDKSATALNNTNYPIVNRVVNAVGSQVSPDLKGRLNAFNMDVQALSSEMERVYRGTGGSAKEIEVWKQSMNNADSDQAIRAGLKEGVNLLASRMHALGDQYGKGMGKTSDGLELLSPKAQEVFNRLTNGGGASASSSGGKTIDFNSLPK